MHGVQREVARAGGAGAELLGGLVVAAVVAGALRGRLAAGEHHAVRRAHVEVPGPGVGRGLKSAARVSIAFLRKMWVLVIVRWRETP